MRFCCLVSSLLFSAVFSFVLCDKPDAETVKKIIAASNQYFKENNLTEDSLGEFFITPILFNEGRIRSLDTLELQGDPVIVEKEEKDGVRYEFKLKLSLKEMNVKYQYEVELPIVHPKGIFSMEIGKNLFYADVYVTLGNDGSCSAVLKDAYVSALDDYQVHLNPKDVWLPALRKYLEKSINKIVHDELGTVISLNILGKKLADSFKENFKNVVCSGLKKSE